MNKAISCKHNCSHKYKANTDPIQRICTLTNQKITKNDLEYIKPSGDVGQKLKPEWCPLRRGLNESY